MMAQSMQQPQPGNQQNRSRPAANYSEPRAASMPNLTSQSQQQTAQMPQPQQDIQHPYTSRSVRSIQPESEFRPDFHSTESMASNTSEN